MSTINDNITLPSFLPKNAEDKRILGEFYDTFHKMQWFGKAELFENHPTQMKKTLEVTVRYIPTLEMKEILTWLHKYQMGLEWKVIESPQQGQSDKR